MGFSDKLNKNYAEPPPPQIGPLPGPSADSPQAIPTAGTGVTKKGKKHFSRKGVRDLPGYEEPKPLEGPPVPSGTLGKSFTSAQERVALEEQALEAGVDAQESQEYSTEFSQGVDKSFEDRSGTALPEPMVGAPDETQKVEGRPLQTGSWSSQRTIVEISEEARKAQEEADRLATDAARERAKIEGEHHGLSADLNENLANSIRKSGDEYQQLHEYLMRQQQQRLRAIEEMISASRFRVADPSAFFTNQGEAAGFGAAMATAVGHIASQLGGGTNAALATIERAVARNIAAQEFNITQSNLADQQQISLLGRWEAITKNKLEAKLLAEASLLSQAQYQLEALKNRTNSKLADVQFAEVQAKLQQAQADRLLAVDKMNTRTVTRTGIIYKEGIDAQKRAEEEKARRDYIAGQRGGAPAPGPYLQEQGDGMGPLSNSAFDRAQKERSSRQNQVASLEEFGGMLQNDPKTVGQRVRRELKGVRDRQAETGRKLTEAEARALWESNPYFRFGVADYRSLIYQDTVEIGRGKHRYRTSPLTDQYREDNKTNEKTGYYTQTQALGRLDDWLDDSRNVKRLISKQGFSGVSRSLTGTWQISKADAQARENFERIVSQMKNAFNTVRVTEGGGAMNGKGEAEIFEKMIHQPDGLDAAFTFFMKNYDTVLAAYTVLEDDMMKRRNSTKQMLGLSEDSDDILKTNQITERFNSGGFNP